MKISKKGFTLIEILLVIAIIAILAAIVIIAINPAKQLRDARNAERESEVNTILNAITQYTIDNNGDLPGTVASPIPEGACAAVAEAEICDTAVCDATTVDLSALTASGTYIAAIPQDPQDDSAIGADYHVSKDANGRVTVCARQAEGGKTISITR